MKNTVKALKYSFKLLNQPITYGMLALGLVFIISPIVQSVEMISKYDRSESYMTSLLGREVIEGSMLSMLWIWILSSYFNERIGNCKYNYSASFARKLYTVVPVIYSFFAVTILFVITVCIAAIKLGSDAFSVNYIMISVSFALMGIASSAASKRKKDAVVPYILAFVIFFVTLFRGEDIAEINVAAPVVIVLSFIIIAAGFVFSCWYMNRLWDKGVRFIKQKYGYEYLFGK